jgi:hypothetical protein
MFCSQCGKELPENSKFCSNCGSQIFQEPTQNLNKKLFCTKHALEFLKNEGCPECNNQPADTIKPEPITDNEASGSIYFCKLHGVLLKQGESCYRCSSPDIGNSLEEFLKSEDKENLNILELKVSDKQGFFNNLKKKAINNESSSFVSTARTLASQYLFIKKANPETKDLDIYMALLELRYKVLPPSRSSLADVYLLLQGSDDFDFSAFVWIVLLAETELADLDDDTQVAARIVINNTLAQYEGLPKRF